MTVQFASHIGSTPMSLLVKYGMMYPIVGKSAEYFSMCPFAVSTLIVAALVSGGPWGAVGEMKRYVAPEYTILVCCWGRICSCCSFLVGVSVRVRLQLKLTSYIKGSLLGYLCITVCAVTQSFWFVVFRGSNQQAFFLCGSVQATATQCVHKFSPPGNVPPLPACVPLFFKAFTFSDKSLISWCCLATLSNEISRLAANYTIGPPFAAVWVAAASILFKYDKICP